MHKFLERYQQGECVQVWNELYALGTDVRDPSVYFEALAVAHETMQRVRRNIQILIPRLQASGYNFGYTWMTPMSQEDTAWIADQPALYTFPPHDIAQQIERFETMAGPLPLSLRAFYSEVGSVNFIGTHPMWEEYFRAYTVRGLEPPNLDPLFVWGLSEAIFDDYTSWQEWVQREGEEGEPYLLPIAGDAYLKYNISGDEAYEIALPNASADAPLLNEWHRTTFVNYLRICLQYAGLPGLERIRLVIPNELTDLTRDLLPF